MTKLSIIAVAADGAETFILTPHAIHDESAKWLADTLLSETAPDAVLDVDHDFVTDEGHAATILAAGILKTGEMRPKVQLTQAATRLHDVRGTVYDQVGDLHGDMWQPFTALHINRPDRIKLVFEPFPRI